jgi:uncharacterized protein YutE (UPF0331/DUF86 family)
VSPGLIDPTRVRRHLVALDEILAHLECHTGRDVKVLSEHSDERWSVERGLQLCTQCVLDIATHLVASAGRDAPDYATAIDLLGELKILSPELATKLRPLAGFRNALVHGYLQIDVVRLHAVLNEHLDDVREFARCVNVFVGKQE